MNILIVDSSAQELKVLKTSFFGSDFQLHYLADERLTMNALTKLRFDVIITASKFQNLTAKDILKEVIKKHPNLVRIVINNTDDDTKYNQVAHYSFKAPVDPEKIRGVIESFAQRTRSITKESIVKLVASIKSLPSPPKVYMQLNALLSNVNADSQKIAEIITQDPALTAKVLQFSNSSALNKGKPLNNIPDAITKVGVETLCCIVMTAELFSYEPSIENFSLLNEQMHSLSVAKFAASLVKTELKQETMLAGLLHDLGKLVLFEIDPKLTAKYLAHIDTTSNTILLEQKIFNTNHCHICAYLLHHWSFPYSTIESIVNHHSPQKLMQGSFGVSQAVYLANALLRKQEPDEEFVRYFKMEPILDKLKIRAEKFT